MIRLLTRFRGDRSGVSAIEFAFIAPVLIAAYFGLAEMSGAMLAERKASLIASEVGDLVAQDTTIHDSDMSDIFSVANTVMAPLSTTTLSMRVTGITSNATTGATTVDWSNVSGTGLSALTHGNAITVPTGLISAGGYIVKSEVQYTYSSPVSDFIKTPLTFNEVFYLAPRQSTTITRTSP